MLLQKNKNKKKQKKKKREENNGVEVRHTGPCGAWVFILPWIFCEDLSGDFLQKVILRILIKWKVPLPGTQQVHF